MDFGLALLQMYPNISPSEYELVAQPDGSVKITQWNETGTPQPAESDVENWWNNTGQLTHAKNQKKVSLQQSFQASLLNGFTSTADGTSRAYAIDPVAMAKWTGALSVINSGRASNMTVKDFSGNKVTLTSAQFQQMAADGFTFFNAQEQHLWDLEDEVDADTTDTVDKVNAITW